MSKNTWFWVLVTTLIATVIAGAAAFFSVFGLAKLFAGAGVYALILFGAIEIGKLVSVSVLYRFWKKFSWGLKTALTTMVIVVMFITSMGIYGFLRNAYDKTSNEYNIIQKEVNISEQKKSAIQLEIDRYQQDIDSKNSQINTYIGNRNIQESSMAEMRNKGADTNFASGERWVFRDNANKTQNSVNETNEQINVLRDQNGESYGKINALNDSISSIDRNILELESNDIAIEIGPYKYLSELSGIPIDNVVGYLIFIIMFVFDPFAIVLIIVANRLSMIDRDNKTEEKISNIVNRFKKKDKNEEYIEKKRQLQGLPVRQSTDNVSDEPKSVKKKDNSVPNEELENIRNELKALKDKLNSTDNVVSDKENTELLNVINNMKNEFNERLNIIDNKVKKNDTQEVTVTPGRYSHGRGFRPEKRE